MSWQTQTRSGVAMECQRQINLRLDSPDQRLCLERFQQSRHILDTQGVTPQVLQSLGKIDPVLHLMHRTCGVAERALGVSTDLEGGLYRTLQIPYIVHRIKDPKHIHSIVMGPLHKMAHQVIRIMAVAQQVLPPQQHLLRRLRHQFFELAQANPGILSQIADARIKGRAAP